MKTSLPTTHTGTNTLFTKANLVKDGAYLMYSPTGRPYASDNVFVARFKYDASRKAGPFSTFLRRNFTVEEYFTLRDAGGSPLGILNDKGYISPPLRKLCRDNGFPVTREGYEAYTAHERDLREVKKDAWMKREAMRAEAGTRA